MANRKRGKHKSTTPGATPGKVGRRPPKPYPDFPLFAHRNGQWCKKIRGRHVYFGPWADPEAALQEYLSQRDHLLAGQQPPPQQVTLDELVNRFLASKRQAVELGEISGRHYHELKREGEFLLDTLGRSTPSDRLGPEQFAHLRARLVDGLAATTIANRMIRIRSIFKWGHVSRLLEHPPHYGTEFKRPSARALRRARNQAGPRIFAAAQIRALLDATADHPYLHACILLGINCGLGNTDCSKLRLEHLDLTAGRMDFPRPKTEAARRAALWPETVRALQAALQLREKRIEAIEARRGDLVDRVFVTRLYAPLVTINPTGTQTNTLSREFRKVAKTLGIPAGLGFYALRRTYRTIADETRDWPAIDLTMGHLALDAQGTPFAAEMGDRYRGRIKDERLTEIAEHVYQWLHSESS